MSAAKKRLRSVLMVLGLLVFGIGATGAAAGTAVADGAVSPAEADVPVEAVDGSCETQCDNGHCSAEGLIGCGCSCDDGGDPSCGCFL